MNKTIKAPGEKSNFWRYALISYAVFLVAFVVYCIITANKNLYPDFSGDVLLALGAAFCLFSLPWLCVTVAIWAFKFKKHWAIKAAAVVLGVITLIVGTTMGSLLLALNLSSATSGLQNYLIFDEEMSMSEKGAELFPAVIPEEAENPQYYYAFCPVQTSFTLVQGTWILPEGAFETEVERIKSVMEGAETPDVKTDDERDVILSLNNQSVMAVYNEETRKVMYHYSGE